MFKNNLLGGLLALVLFFSMVGCQGGAAPTQSGTETQGAGEESTIVIVVADEPPSFNPIITDAGFDSLAMELVMLGLTDVDPDGDIFPELAAELPNEKNGGVTIDEDAATMTVTWKMRQDVKWADGTPVTADDAIFTFAAIRDPELGAWIPGLEYVDSVEKVDDYTFTIYYNSIYPGYLTQLGGEQVALWPAHYCDATQGFAAWDCARTPLSNGPYILDEWEAGDHLTFVKNENYHVKGKPEIDRIIMRVVPDREVRKTMLINGDADLDMRTPEAMLADLQDEPNVKVSISPDNRWVMRIFFNLAAKGTTDPDVTPHPILSDVRVRRAIRMAIDVDTISKEFFLGYAEPVWTEFFRPPYVCKNIPRPKFDAKAAAALLEEAGWKDTDGDGVRECHGCKNAEEGYKMEMEFITYAEYGESLELTQQLIAEMLGKIGIKLNISVVEGSVLWASTENGGIEQSGNFDMDIWDDGYSGVDPTHFLRNYYSADAAMPDLGYNYGRWLSADFDSLLGQSYTLNKRDRQDTFCQMAELLEEELPEALLFTAINADAHSARLLGVQSSTNDLVTWNAADWTLAK
ncbi:MAG: peptide ABC transporter substrate-binding protein [Chloroflexi bacterium]|nr:peptide ABC transporter substrate-binding protein [Chloroflexota bacterium]